LESLQSWWIQSKPAYKEMKSKEKIDRDRHEAEQKLLADQKATLILINKFDGLTEDGRAVIEGRITSFRNEAEHGTRYPQT